MIDKECANCGNQYKANHHSSLYCPPCKAFIYKIHKAEKNKRYRNKYKKKLKLISKIRLQTPEYKKKRREYLSNNRDKINQSANYYRFNRLREDPCFRIKSNMRIRMWKVLKGINKSKSTIELLGCDIEYFKKYIESKFIEGMSWDNYGKWHLDHIVACWKFDLTKHEEQKKCFHYTNLQPLWSKDNLSKRDHWDVIKPWKNRS